MYRLGIFFEFLRKNFLHKVKNVLHLVKISCHENI